MKPSEFMKKINLDVIGDTSELDERFIDREQLIKDIDEVGGFRCGLTGGICDSLDKEELISKIKGDIR